jgi:hypothetical protein
MSASASRLRSSNTLRYALGLCAVTCILGAVVLGTTNGVVKVDQVIKKNEMNRLLVHIAVAINNYHQANGTFPPPALLDRDGKPLLSWRVAILPYMEQAHLYLQFKLDEPWDSEHNRKLIDRMPVFYEGCTNCGVPPHTTFLQMIRGRGTAFERPGLTSRDFMGRRCNTFLIVEAATPVIWTKPADLEYDPDGPLPELGGILRDGTFRAIGADCMDRTLKISDTEAIRFGITGKEP